MTLQMLEGLTYDDVLLMPQKSSAGFEGVDCGVELSPQIRLHVPFLVRAHGDGATAIGAALSGGLGVLRGGDTSSTAQATGVHDIRRFKNSFIEDPVSVSCDALVGEVIDIRNARGYGIVPVLDNRKLAGLITSRDYVPSEDAKRPVTEVMSPLANLVVAEAGINLGQAIKIIRDHQLDALPILSKEDELISLVTRKDLELHEQYPNATQNRHRNLLVAAEIGVGEEELARARQLLDAGASVLVVHAHPGYSVSVLETVRALKKDRAFSDIEIYASNIATYDGAKDVISAGADAIIVREMELRHRTKPCSVGVPILTAITEVARATRAAKKSLIASIRWDRPGDAVKALAAGAQAVLLEDNDEPFTSHDAVIAAIEDCAARLQRDMTACGASSIPELQKKSRFIQTAKFSRFDA